MMDRTTVVPVIIWVGNSQGCTNPSNFLASSGSPEFAPMPANGSTPSTLDVRKQVWNTRERSWQMLDITSNANGWHLSRPGTWGIPTILAHYAAQRFGMVRIVNLCSPGSTIEWAPGSVSHGTWDPDVPTTQTGGPTLLRHIADAEINAAMAATVAEGLAPRVVLTGMQLGENDLARSATFEDKARSLIEWLRLHHRHGRIGREDPAPHVVVRVSPQHPGGTAAQLCEIQAALNSLHTIPGVVMVGHDISSEEHRFEPESTAGPRQYPRTERQHHGTHLTGPCLLRLAREIAEAVKW